MRKRWTGGVFFFFVLFSPIGGLYPILAFGADSISMEPHLGFNGTFPLNNWTPLSVLLENRGRDFQGRLELITTSGSEYRNDVRQRTYVTEVDLPQNSQKVFTFTAFIDSYSHPLIIRLLHDGKPFLYHSLNLRNHFVTQPILLFAGESPNDLSSLVIEDYQPVYSPLRSLPDHWYGYLGVKGLVLKTGSLRSLRIRQFRALEQWIKSGGYLILVGTPLENLPPKESMESILPCKILGFEQKRNLPALERFSNYPLFPRNPILILKTTSAPAAALLKEGDLPLILEKNQGLGKILFLTFDITDLPFRNWPGRTGFWENILQKSPTISDLNLQALEEKIFPLMLSNLPGRFPYFFLALFLCLGYILLIALVLKMSEKNRERGKRWLFLLVSVSTVASLIFWGLSALTQTGNTLTANGFLVLRSKGPQDPAQWKYHWGLYSQQDRDYRLPLEMDALPKAFYATENPALARFQSYVIEEKGEALFLKFSLQRWTHRFFTLSLLHSSPLQGQAQFQEPVLLLKLENHLSAPLQNCYVYFGGHLLPWGDLPPGKRFSKKWSLKDMDFPEDFIPPGIQNQRIGRKGLKPSPLRKELEKNMSNELWETIHRRYQGNPEVIILLGWMDALIFPPSLKQPLPFQNGAGLVIWEIPLEKSPPLPFGDEDRRKR
ncbi:MAG: hypothetical protein AB1585_19390 [Thermodesulfobacteriota bacterium]